MIEALKTFEMALCRDLHAQVRELVNWNSLLKQRLGENAALFCEPLAAAELVGDELLGAVEFSIQMLRIQEYWFPICPAYDQWIDCLPVIARVLGHGYVAGWTELSNDSLDRLETPALGLVEGIGVVREWLQELRCYQRAIGPDPLAVSTPVSAVPADWRLPRIEPPATPPKEPVPRLDSVDGSEEVDTRHAAELLGVSKHTVISYLKEGRLSYRNAARTSSTRPRYRISLQSILQFRQHQIQRPAPGPAVDAKKRPQSRRNRQPKEQGEYTPKHLKLD